MVRNGIYPYEYISDISKLKEKQIPSKDKFNSMLSCGKVSKDEFKNMRPLKISVADYFFAQKVFKTFNCKNVGDYTALYCKLDVLPLADVFESFTMFVLESIK